jgi:hypothetical protein
VVGDVEMSEREKFRILIQGAIEAQAKSGHPHVILGMTPENARELLALMEGEMARCPGCGKLDREVWLGFLECSDCDERSFVEALRELIGAGEAEMIAKWANECYGTIDWDDMTEEERAVWLLEASELLVLLEPECTCHRFAKRGEEKCEVHYPTGSKIAAWLKERRFGPQHLGLGDIRLTMADQMELLAMMKPAAAEPVAIGLQLEIQDGEGWKDVGQATTMDGLHWLIRDYAGLPNPIRAILAQDVSPKLPTISDKPATPEREVILHPDANMKIFGTTIPVKVGAHLPDGVWMNQKTLENFRAEVLAQETEEADDDG